MTIGGLKLSCLALLTAFNLQSLVDVAREEAERRKRLEEQGIVAKVIDGNATGSGRKANITISTEGDYKPKEAAARPDSAKSKESVRGYRQALQKLDRAIQQTESRLSSNRARSQAAKWQNPQNAKSSNRGQPKDLQAQLQAEAVELELKLKQLREERFEVYEAGKKAGFMPGELDGKGIIP